MRDMNLEDLVESARLADQPAPEHASQLFEQVMAGLPAASLGSSVGAKLPDVSSLPGPLGKATTGTTTQAAGYTKLIVALLGAGGIGAGMWLATSASEPAREEKAPPTASIPAPIKTGSAVSEVRRPLNDEEIALSEGSEEESEKQPVASPAKNQAPAEDTLARELTLVRGAKVALNNKDPVKALALLDEYDQRFPKGALRGEAGATRVLALCALKQSGQAEDAAARLDAESPLGKRMKAGCKVP